MIYRITIIIVSLLIVFGCSEHRHDNRLSRIEAAIPESPEEALSRLDSIDRHSLFEADRYYYDLLKIKAADKAYIKHTSDSVILKVIDYYASHGRDNLYPEALYYGARTYRDLGDTPTALRYFHEALDNISEDESQLVLKGNILSQTGRLLTDLRLYDEAVPYIENVIQIDEHLGDTVNLVYDLQLLGGTYLRGRNYPEAEHYFRKALELSHSLPPSFRAKSQMYLAEIKYEIGQYDSALNLIRDTPDVVSSMARNSALAYASKIYLQNELPDTAYMYAYALIHSHDSTNKKTGYQTLLSPELQAYIPLDTLYQYLYDYGNLIETYYDENKIQLAINQQNFYNYQQHETQRRKAEAHNIRLIWWIYGISTVCLVLTVIVLYYKNKTRKTLSELRIALKNANRLKEIIDYSNPGRTVNYDNDKYPEGNPPEKIAEADIHHPSLFASKTEIELRSALQKELLDLYNKNVSVAVSKRIYDSAAYKKLQELIGQKRILPYEDSLWDELESVVLKSSPKFKDNLQLLTQSRLTSLDLHTALLIKCHVLPSQMSVLLGRSKGAIVSRRESLSLKIFGEKLGTKVIDGIIRLL